jgi:glycosyltransferase involved in cell wall biosynthesis
VRVVINAALHPGGEWGGVEQFVIGLVSGLGKLTAGIEKYCIVVHPATADWLNPYLGYNAQIVVAPPARGATFKRWLGPLRVSAGKLLRASRHQVFGTPLKVVPKSTGYYESLGADVVHFPFQMFSICDTPFIYNPHDLQHLHYPEFFKREDIAAREVTWPMACRLAAAVATDARWVRDDVSVRYGIKLQKIYSIPMGPPTEVYGTVSENIVAEVNAKFDLPDAFAFYPAQTWPHKNHLRLIEALALLRDRGLNVNLVCTGKQNEHSRVIVRRIRDLGLEKQVRFLGFIAPLELRALYRLAQFVIHPSIFEGGGLPILEAFREGVPVACANTTSLPEYAGDAALLFDPMSADCIAQAIRQMVTNAELRDDLRQKGSKRIRLFTWERTAKTYRALYRLLGKQPLTEEDRYLLAEAQDERSGTA